MALNDDAIAEILLRLPAKSVCRFRCVSKLWLSHTSSPRFIRAHTAAATSWPSAFYVYEPVHRRAELFYLDGGGGGSHDPTLSFLDFQGIPPEPVDSCNGLLLCRLPALFVWKQAVLSVCNPATKDHEVIPLSDALRAQITTAPLRLAFDPRRSPHYMIFAVVMSFAPPTGKLTYKYASESRTWKTIEDERLSSWPGRPTVYWNGSFVWWTHFSMLVALDAEGEQMRALLPPPPGTMKQFLHLGASGERLHYIRGENRTRFEILEMASESSGWRLLHRIDLASLSHLCDSYSFTLLEFIRGDDDRLFLRMPAKIVSYHPRRRTFTFVCQINWELNCYKIVPLAHILFPLNVNKIGASPSQRWVSWKSEHDQILISLMVERALNGKKVADGFRIDACHEMVRLFNQETRLNYGVHHLENRLISYKRDHQMVKNILANDGFQWVPSEKVVIASDIDWWKICQDIPKALVYKRKHVPFEDLEIICASSVHIDSKVLHNTGQRKRKSIHD